MERKIRNIVMFVSMFLLPVTMVIAMIIKSFMRAPICGG